MSWVRRLFAAQIVVVSDPFSNGQTWSYIFGDEKQFELRIFQDFESAKHSQTITLTALKLGAPYKFINLIRLDPEQASSLQDEQTYHDLINLHL